MANTLYPKGAEKMLSAQINFADDTIKAILVPSTYTYSAAHEFLSDLGDALGVAQELTNKSTTDGAFDADDITFPTLASGSVIKAVVLYQHTGVGGTSALIAYYDTVTGFPAATNGGSHTVMWSDGTGKIFKL